MANNMQVNWNVVRIGYSSNNATVRMVDKERTCLFHWTHSLDRHTKQLMKLKLQDQHKAFCFDYKNSKSLKEVDIRYVTIYCWWLSIKAMIESIVHKLGNWLAF